MTARTDLDRAMQDFFETHSTNRPPDGLLESTLSAIDATPQRAAWRNVDRWLPTAWADRLTWHSRRAAALVAVALTIAILAALVLLAGSGQRLPEPFGLARPGSIVMDVGGDIYLAGPDGGNRAKLYGGPHWDGHATFSPDGTKIAFESAQDDMSISLMVMRADGTEPTTLMSRLIGVDDVISWSSDSRWIATAARPLDESGGPMFPSEDARIVVGDVERATASFVGAPDLYGHVPRWSPDGTMIAFGRVYPCCSEMVNAVWLMRPDGSDLHALSSVQSGAPSWSPDGKWIAFLGKGAGGDADLFLASSDGSGQEQLTDDPGDASFPVWSPDGTRIAFARMLDAANKGELKILDVSDGRVTTLEGANVTHDPPVWSPDGTHILAYLYTKPDNPDHVSQYEALAMFDVTNDSMPVEIRIVGLRYASWQRLAP